MDKVCIAELLAKQYVELCRMGHTKGQAIALLLKTAVILNDILNGKEVDARRPMNISADELAGLLAEINGDLDDLAKDPAFVERVTKK